MRLQIAHAVLQPYWLIESGTAICLGARAAANARVAVLTFLFGRHFGINSGVFLCFRVEVLSGICLHWLGFFSFEYVFK